MASTAAGEPAPSKRALEAMAAVRQATAGIESSNPCPMPRLPPEAVGWTQFELDLFRLSEGEYNPTSMARRRRLGHVGAPAVGTGAYQQISGRVSIVSPTLSSRQHYHEQLWACFEAQTWEDKELIVVETYETSPSAFLQQKAKEDPRLVHVCFKRPPGNDFSVGLKRDMTLHLASGALIVNFDDDDIYASSYAQEMVEEMDKRGLVALTLSSWYNYIVPRQVCAYSDPESWEPWDEDELEEVLYGYGFSYVHKREFSLMLPYPDVEFAEDAPFLLKLKQIMGNDKVGLRRDTKGICMHIVHRANSTGVDGESISHEVSRDELNGLSVASLPVFQRYLEMHATSWWHLLPFSTWRLGFLSPSSAAPAEAAAAASSPSAAGGAGAAGAAAAPAATAAPLEPKEHGGGAGVGATGAAVVGSPGKQRLLIAKSACA